MRRTSQVRSRGPEGRGPEPEPIRCDVHSHLLPGIDDGAKDWDEALAMAELAAHDGTTHICLTPHHAPGFYENKPEQIRALTLEFRARLADAKIGIEILPGCEYMLRTELAREAAAGEILTLADGGEFILVELPAEHIPQEAEKWLFDLQLAGFTPVLAHPERNRGIQRNFDWAERFVERGGILQVTAGALVGQFGERAMLTAEEMARRGIVGMLGSDAHWAEIRTPLLSEGARRLAQLAGPESLAQILGGPLYRAA